eukprot:CAMPEP_0179154928 /NCGR_PEP_ID=MMETSP0796-20121207/75435_1 /TAXON_ID=73915 /ORGANISM="Pyrodinium bahamense, Strain pbaha01" /LENGTH=234 /DNA_ID=CAMNT_0020856359 /DNA_START=103 /DNA_END=805 /DNA_ORIENTATION=-
MQHLAIEDHRCAAQWPQQQRILWGKGFSVAVVLGPENGAPALEGTEFGQQHIDRDGGPISVGGKAPACHVAVDSRLPLREGELHLPELRGPSEETLCNFWQILLHKWKHLVLDDRCGEHLSFEVEIPNGQPVQAFLRFRLQHASKDAAAAASMRVSHSSTVKKSGINKMLLRKNSEWSDAVRISWKARPLQSPHHALSIRNASDAASQRQSSESAFAGKGCRHHSGSTKSMAPG